MGFLSSHHIGQEVLLAITLVHHILGKESRGPFHVNSKDIS